VRCPVQSYADFGALGAMVGRMARNRVPYFRVSGSEFRVPSSQVTVSSSELAALSTESQTRNSKLETVNSKPQTYVDLFKGLGAAMAASGAVALYHIEGVTLEADEPDIIAPDAETFVVQSLDEGYAALDSGGEGVIDLVWIGCPHASLDELALVIGLLAGRQVRTALWVTMAREMRTEAEKAGLVQALEGSGGRVVADTCLVVAPVRELGFRRMATPSGKGAYYAPSHSGLAVRYGPLEVCIEAAVTGRWQVKDSVYPIFEE
jgi:predicted aconitase